MKSDFQVDFPNLGITDIPVSREAFTIFGQTVYWYGILIALAIILCLLLASKNAAEFGMKSDDILDTFIVIIPMLIIFARLFYVIFEWEEYAGDLTRIFDTRHGGLAFYGGVIGGALAIFLVARFKKMPISKLLDFLVVYVPLGQAVGRWGNFFNQEAFGTNTTLPWGMFSNETERYLRVIGGYNPSAPVHPTFLYEFIGNLIIFMILLRLRKKDRQPFVLTFSYLGMYGFMRFFVESIRTDALYIGDTNLRISMVLSALMVLAAVIYIIMIARYSEKRMLQQAIAEAQNADKQTAANDEAVEADISAAADSSSNADNSETSDDFVVIADDQKASLKSKNSSGENDFIEIDDPENKD